MSVDLVFPPTRDVIWRKLLRRRASPGAEQRRRTISPESHNIIHATRKQNCTDSNVPAGPSKGFLVFFSFVVFVCLFLFACVGNYREI